MLVKKKQVLMLVKKSLIWLVDSFHLQKNKQHVRFLIHLIENEQYILLFFITAILKAVGNSQIFFYTIQISLFVGI